MNRRSFSKALIAGAGLFSLASFDAPAKQNAYPANNNHELMDSIRLRLINGEDLEISCYGDSVMWGATPYKLEKQSPKNGPSILESVLQQIFRGEISVKNLGISGSTLSGFVSGTDGSGTSISAKAGMKTDMIYINHGVNDMFKDGSISEYRKNLNLLVDAFNKNGVAVVFVTPSIVANYFFGDVAKSSKIKIYVNAMLDVAKSKGVPVVNQFENTYRDSMNHSLREIVPDGVHMSDFNYNQLGYNLASQLINYAKISQGDKFKFITLDIGSKSKIEVDDEKGNGYLKVYGLDLNAVFIPIMSNEKLGIDISTESKKTEVDYSVNGSYFGKITDGIQYINLNPINNYRTGMKVIKVSSRDSLKMTSIYGMGSL